MSVPQAPQPSGAGPRTAATLAWHAVPAWICPSRHLYDRPERMRASLGTVLAAWAVLAGLAAVFVQLTQAQGSAQRLTLARYPVIQWSYWVFDGAVIVSLLAVAAGGLPLWLRMFRDVRAARRRREAACLLAPAVVPAAYLAASAAIAGLVRQAGASVVPWQARPVVDLANGNVGPWWFLALVLLGFAAAAPAYAGYHESWPLAVYLPVVLLASAVAVVSAARGIRAARSPAPG
jgi:hypothetical protein